MEVSRLRRRRRTSNEVSSQMGVVPLVLSTGVGAEMRSAMGVTALGLFLTPIFYVLVRRLTGSAVVGNRSQGIGPACPHAPGELN